MVESTSQDQHLTDPNRLRSLTETGLLDAPERLALQRFAHIASRALDASVSLVSLVDRDRQFFAAAHGLDARWKKERETPLSHSFCQHVVNQKSALVVEDARNDERVCDNLAIDELHVGAYAGVPLKDSEGNVLGSFCVMGSEPRKWEPAELRLLQFLADSVAEEIELARRTHIAEQAEAELAEVNREIAAAHQRASEQNAAIMHDLRTPLQVVSAAARSIADHPSVKASDSLVRSVDMLRRNIAQAIKLAKSGVYQPEGDDRFERVAVDELVQGVCQDLAAGTSVELGLSVEPAKVFADPMMIKRAVQNLFSNALRFASARIDVAVARRDDMVSITVEDDGEGLPRKEDYNRVWELGRKFHASRSNTGLGLAVTRQLIQALGGKVRAGPSDKGGARFELWLRHANEVH